MENKGQLSGGNKKIANEEISEKKFFQIENVPAEWPKAGLPSNVSKIIYLEEEPKGKWVNRLEIHI